MRCLFALQLRLMAARGLEATAGLVAAGLVVLALSVLSPRGAWHPSGDRRVVDVMVIFLPLYTLHPWWALAVFREARGLALVAPLSPAALAGTRLGLLALASLVASGLGSVAAALAFSRWVFSAQAILNLLSLSYAWCLLAAVLDDWSPESLRGRVAAVSVLALSAVLLNHLSLKGRLGCGLGVVVLPAWIWASSRVLDRLAGLGLWLPTALGATCPWLLWRSYLLFQRFTPEG